MKQNDETTCFLQTKILSAFFYILNEAKATTSSTRHTKIKRINQKDSSEFFLNFCQNFQKRFRLNVRDPTDNSCLSNSTIEMLASV